MSRVGAAPTYSQFNNLNNPSHAQVSMGRGLGQSRNTIAFGIRKEKLKGRTQSSKARFGEIERKEQKQGVSRPERHRRGLATLGSKR